MQGALYRILRNLSNPQGSQWNWDEVVETGLTWDQALAKQQELQKQYSQSNPNKTGWTSDLYLIEMEINAMGEKVKSRAKSKSDVLRDMRERQAKAKTPAPAKPKPAKAQRPKKVATGKAKKSESKKSNVSDSNVKFESASTLLALKADAVRIDRDIDDAFAELGKAVDSLKSKHALVEDFIDRELWRFCCPEGSDVPYANETEWKRNKQGKLGSASMLFNISSAFKALKGETTQEQRAQMGPRKRAVATAARKKSGEPLPPEIITAAADPKVTEKEFREQVESAGLGPEPEPPVDDRQESFPMPEAEVSGVREETSAPKEEKPDPLLAKTGKNTKPVPLRKGGSGVAEGEPGTAMQFGGRLQQAVLQWSKLYDDLDAREPLSPMQRLEQVCIMFGESPVDMSQVLDREVRSALEHRLTELKPGDVLTNEKAFEFFMHSPRKHRTVGA